MPRVTKKRAVKKDSVNPVSYNSFKGQLRTPEVFTSTIVKAGSEELRNCANCEWSPSPLTPSLVQHPMPAIEEHPSNEMIGEISPEEPILEPLVIRVKRGDNGQINRARIISRRRHDLANSLYKSIMKTRRSKRQPKQFKAKTSDTDQSNTSFISQPDVKEKSSLSEISKIRLAFENMLIQQNSGVAPTARTPMTRSQSKKSQQPESLELSSRSRISETTEETSSSTSTSSKGSRRTSNRRKQTIRKSAPIKIYQCTEPGCEKRFAKQSTRSNHQLTHLDEESRSRIKLTWKNICYLCNTKLRTPQGLQIHFKSHGKVNDSPTFPCPICDKQYSLKRNLAAHIKNKH